MPSIKKLDNGMTRRIRVINYPFQFVHKPLNSTDRKVNIKLKDAFKNDEILKDAFTMLLLTYAYENINEDLMELPEAVTQSIGEYIDENNPIKSFLEEYFIITKNNKDKILCSEFNKKYNLYNSNKISSIKIKKDMLFNGFDEHKNSGNRYYYGLLEKELQYVKNLLDD